MVLVLPLAKMKTSLDGTIKQLEYNGYNYTNITTLSTFEKIVLWSSKNYRSEY
jgi:hypothetical protein